MTGYGGPGYGSPRRHTQPSFEDSGSWGGFLHPEEAPVTERIPRVRPTRDDFPVPPTEEWRPAAPPPLPPAPPGRGRRRLLVAVAVLGVLVLVLAGAATFIVVKGGDGGHRKAAGPASASPTPAVAPSVVPHVAVKGKPVAPTGAPYSYGIPAGFVAGTCLVTQGDGAPQHPTCVQPAGASTQDMVLVMNFPITVNADALHTADIERQLDKLYADRLHSTYQYLSVDGARAWRTQLSGAGTTSIEVHLFKGKQHIQVLCQWTAAHQQQVGAGCNAVLATLTVTG
jgi:hypothetical protein